MKNTRWCAGALMLIAASAQVGAQAPKPPAEVAKLAAFVGTWKYEGDAKASPMGPAAKISVTQTGKMTMNGFFLQWTGEEKGAFGGVQWGETDGYDAAAKGYPYFGYQNDGTLWSGVGTVNGNAWRYLSTITVKGVTYHSRTDGVLAADGKSYTWKQDVSTDGKVWALWTQGKMTKVP